MNVNGQFEVVQIKPDGSLTTIWQRTNAFPVDMAPNGDSLVIAESPVSGGGYTFRMIPVAGGGEGRVLLRAGESFGTLSDDGATMLYAIPNGSTADIGVLNRADGDDPAPDHNVGRRTPAGNEPGQEDRLFPTCPAEPADSDRGLEQGADQQQVRSEK